MRTLLAAIVVAVLAFGLESASAASPIAGTYLVGAAAPCAGASGPAQIVAQNGKFYGINPCGAKVEIDESKTGQLVMGKLVGDWDPRLRTIFWKNTTQWINMRSRLVTSYFGYWAKTGKPCTSGPARRREISVNAQGSLTAVNECSQGTHLILRPNGSIEAADWSHLVGVFTRPDFLNWKGNGSVWTR